MLLVLIAPSILGNRTLVLYGGNRLLAARFYKTLYIALGAGMLGCAVPALVTAFALQLRAQSYGAWVETLLSDCMLYNPHDWMRENF